MVTMSLLKAITKVQTCDLDYTLITILRYPSVIASFKHKFDQIR